MFNWRQLRQMHKGILVYLALLMALSLLVIASKASYSYSRISEDLLPFEVQLDRAFWVPRVKSQFGWCVLSWGAFLVCAALDYRRLREWSWPLYALTLIALVGLFFVPAIQSVHRWYRIQLLQTSLQPAEVAKFTTIFALAWWCERFAQSLHQLWPTLGAMWITCLPFALILKEPDLGTALMLWPVCVGILSFAGGHLGLVRFWQWSAGLILVLVASLFLGLVPFETIEPAAARVLKEYQLERLRPDEHHQRAAMAALAIGGIAGQGWHRGVFSTRGWLPEPYTDAIFPSLGEEFGLVGMGILLIFFYRLLVFGLEVALAAQDGFGRYLAIGVTVNCAAHVIVNIAMMAGLFPVTGVPLPLISYGGSSMLANMMGWGILQSIYCRRFMFR